MMLLCYLFYLCFVLQVAGEDSVELVRLHDHHSIPVSPQVLSHTAVLVPNGHLHHISRSVLVAESWTRANVLAHYPGINITTIVAAHNLLCDKGQEKTCSLVLPSLRNIHHTLTRWGLHKEIKVSASFSSACLLPNSGKFRPELAELHIKPILSFLQDSKSPYLVNPSSNLPTLSEDDLILLKSHSDALEDLGFSNLNINQMIIKDAKQPKLGRRKLSSFQENKIVDPIPVRPTPLSPISPPGIGSSAPAGSPLPPWLGTVSPPPQSHPVTPPAYPPYGFHLPPCTPSGGHGGGAVAAPSAHPRGLWCVAKPSVPPEALQEALDYACGQGGADCAAIKPRGSCYYPNTIVAHASFAFNSYWQKNKGNGGTCGFQGTAMLIDSDPRKLTDQVYFSAGYGRCRFTLG
ncbi:OLC1v1011472C1 [Oldenlandia corymbosa var. corymbosa]|uniref:OLC1v1011472C1 n=1 Tax=Oldenlandia corymbosa var. corymbosa TaxID=529605 RepID=A0AAV1DTP6_OLDCO|nr:OLC1v1011472C1 [Oldenlandia corymbosa var. corymbosa]